MKLTLTGRCASCHEHHPEDVMCPPFEVRTTGQGWFHIYVRELETEIERLREYLEDLLARIHRDGGHHTTAVGLEQSVKDAHEKWARLQEAAEAEAKDDSA